MNENDDILVYRLNTCLSNRRHGGFLIGMVLTMLLLASPARSALIYVPTGGTNYIAPTKTDWNNNWVFGQFNPALGTLIAVHFTAATAMSGYLGVENLNTTKTMSGLVGMDTSITLSNAYSHTVDSIDTNSWDHTANLAKYDGVLNYTGTSGTNWNNVAASTNWSSVITNAAELAYYKGTTNVTIVEIAHTTTDAHGAANISFRTTNYASGSFSIWYEYTPATGVPEPSTWLVSWALLGVAVLGAARRRWRSAKSRASGPILPSQSPRPSQ